VLFGQTMSDWAIQLSIYGFHVFIDEINLPHEKDNLPLLFPITFFLRQKAIADRYVDKGFYEDCTLVFTKLYRVVVT
jgi:hypothetical protein